MNTPFEIFNDHLNNFSASVLPKYGYQTIERNREAPGPAVEGKPVHTARENSFQSPKPSLTMSISVASFSDGRFFMNMTMHDQSQDLFQKFFSLSDYIAEHRIEGFPTIVPAGENFEAAVKAFFAKLTTAFETYLQDQVTGKRFEFHDQTMGK